MPTRKTRRRAAQSGGGFFDTMRNGFRRLFTSSSDSGSVAPTTAPVTPAVPAAPVPAAPVPAPAAITAPAAPINRRQNKINIVPPMPNQKSNEQLMIGGKRRNRRSRRSRRNRN